MITASPVLLATFDIAGTLVEDTGTLLRSFLQAFELNGIPVREEEIEELRGAPKRFVVSHIVSRHLGQGSPQIEDKVTATYSTFRRLLEDNYKTEELKPIAGAEDALDWLRHKKILIATTTGFYRDVRDLILEKLRWNGPFFDCNISSDDVPKGRPAPYMIFECMKLLSVMDVNSVIAIGDTPLDLQAGCNAGCSGVIGVLSGSHGIESLGMTRHTHIITSVAKLPELIEKEFL